jgi:flagellar motor switch protein FliM
MHPLLSALSEAWAEVQPMRFEVLSHPGQPRPGEDLDGEAPVLCVTFLIGGSGPTGAIRYCLATQKLEAQLAGETEQKLLGAPKARSDPRVERVVREVRLPIAAVLGRARVPLRELSQLSPGDVIPLERRIDEPLEVYCGQRPKFMGYAGHRRGRYALTVTRRLERNQAERPEGAAAEGQ